jgi:hypothetical protein
MACAPYLGSHPLCRALRRAWQTAHISRRPGASLHAPPGPSSARHRHASLRPVFANVRHQTQSAPWQPEATPLARHEHRRRHNLSAPQSERVWLKEAAEAPKSAKDKPAGAGIPSDGSPASLLRMARRYLTIRSRASTPDPLNTHAIELFSMSFLTQPDSWERAKASSCYDQ